MVVITPAIYEQLEKIPTIRPPPGVTPNFINPPIDHYSAWIVAATLALTLSTIFVLIRVYTRFFIIKIHGWEDYSFVIAWLGLFVIVFFDFQCFKAGGGVHEWDIPITKIGSSAKVAYVKEIIICPEIFITKLAILLQFKRLFAPHKLGKAHWLILAVIWLNLLYYIAGTLALIFQCTPVSKVWDYFTPGGTCNKLAPLIVAGASLNLGSDIMIIMIPICCISSLRLPIIKKIGVSCVFVTGIFACITSAMRIVTSIRLVHQDDLSYYFFPVILWTDAEIASGIICGCMPVLPPFVNHFYPKIKSCSFVSKLKRYFSSCRRGNNKTGSSPPIASAAIHAGAAQRRSWVDSHKMKPKAKYLELTGHSAMSDTVVDPVDPIDQISLVDMAGGKDLERGLHSIPAKQLETDLGYPPAMHFQNGLHMHPV